jgi:hypothetical protein
MLQLLERTPGLPTAAIAMRNVCFFTDLCGLTNDTLMFRKPDWISPEQKQKEREEQTEESSEHPPPDTVEAIMCSEHRPLAMIGHA